MATFGPRELLDLRAALDWIETHPVLGTLPLALLGESMGASVALLAAADDERVRAVVADSPYARFDSAIEGRMRMALGRAAPMVEPPIRRAGEKMLGFRAHEVAPMEAVRLLAPRPVFLIHGTKDRLIPVENAHVIAAASPENVTFWEVADAQHVQSVFVAGEAYSRRVTEFLDRALA